MSGPLSSTVLDPALLQLLNLVAKATVTTPGGRAPVAISQILGSVTVGSLNCSKVKLTIEAPGPSAPALVTINFPGSPISIVGYISAAALGALMTPNFVQNKNAGVLAGASVSFDSPTISKNGSGLVYVKADITGSISIQTVVSLALYRDGLSGTLLLQKSTSPGGTSPIDFDGTLPWLDTLPDGNPHSYTLVATVGNGSQITVPIGSADFQIFEIPGV